MPTLVVQLGHCYRTTGATGTTGEQAYAAKVGDACMALLHGRGGWSVRLILADAPSSSYSGNAFFAIHCDGSTSPSARGASVGYRTPEGQAAAQAWKQAYAARGWPGFRPDNYTTALAQYYGTGTAVALGNRRAVILECGFRTNSEDRALLDAPGGPERVALSIADALGIPVTPPPEEDDMYSDGDRAMAQSMAARIEALAKGLGNAPNGPDAGERIHQSNHLYEMQHTLRRVTALAPAGPDSQVDAPGPVTPQGDDYALVALLKEMRDDIAAIKAQLNQ